MMSHLILALVGILTLPGCALFLHSPPTDLALESVEIIDKKSELSSTSRMIRLGERQALLRRAREIPAEIKVEFSTRADLVEIERRENHFISGSVGFCDDDIADDRVGSGSQGVIFWAGGAVSKLTPNLEASDQRRDYDRQERKRFTLYINVSRTNPYNVVHNAPPLAAL